MHAVVHGTREEKGKGAKRFFSATSWEHFQATMPLYIGYVCLFSFEVLQMFGTTYPPPPPKFLYLQYIDLTASLQVKRRDTDMEQ